MQLPQHGASVTRVSRKKLLSRCFILSSREPFRPWLRLVPGPRPKTGRSFMPYSSIDQLPDHVRKHLPPHAQHIFVEAFNNAYENLEPGEDEVSAFKIG